MNIKHYAASQRAKLATVLERERLTCSLIATVQGPLTLTWRLRAHNPDSATIKRLLGLGSVLQSALLVESVRVQQVAGLIEVAIPSPAPMTPTASHMQAASRGLDAAIGWDGMAQPITVDLSRHGAIAWVGPSRRGKTQSMRATLFSVARAVRGNLRYAIICQKSKLADWAAFDQSKHSLGCATEPAEIEQCVKWFAERTRIGRWGEFELVLLIDDLPSILDMTDITRPLATVVSVGAGVGIHALLGTQALGSNAGSGGQLVESNVTARIVYRPASKATGARNAGSGGLATDDLSTLPGDAVLLVDGHPERIATARCDDVTVLTLPQGRVDSCFKLWAGAVSGAVSGARSGARSGADTGATVVSSLPTRVGSDGGLVTVPSGTTALSLPGNATPSSADSLLLYREWVRLKSKNATLQTVFGFKNVRVMGYLDAAIQEWGSDAHGTDEKVIVMDARRKA